MNNLEGMAAVICGINNASIKRMKPVWALLDSKVSFSLFPPFFPTQHDHQQHLNQQKIINNYYCHNSPLK